MIALKNNHRWIIRSIDQLLQLRQDRCADEPGLIRIPLQVIDLVRIYIIPIFIQPIRFMRGNNMDKNEFWRRQLQKLVKIIKNKMSPNTIMFRMNIIEVEQPKIV